MQLFDYIIIGGGTAGCVLANRLSAKSNLSILLIEAGGPYRHPILPIPMMGGLTYTIKSTNWNYETAPDAFLNDRRVPWPRGKILGGTSSINGMMYVRGHKWDYDNWASNGASGWSYNDVLPYFKFSEGHQDRSNEYHGNTGPYLVTKSKSNNQLYNIFLKACAEAGHPSTDDFNGHQQEGVGRQDFNIVNGRRICSANAYLKPVIKRRNLKVITHAHATKLLLKDNQVTGVEYLKGGTRGAKNKAYANSEVILCGGTVNSPTLLQLSGIGDPKQLGSVGITTNVPLPAVGKNLQDHLGAYVQHHCLKPITLYRYFRADQAALALARVLLFGNGPGASIALEGGGFLRTRENLEIPDIQITFIPGLSLDTTQRKQGKHGFLTHFYLMRPKSRGQIMIQSTDPFIGPKIEPHSLIAEDDRSIMRDGVKLVRNIMSQSAFEPYRGEEISPGKHILSDIEIDSWIKANATTVWHPTGTCRMGIDQNSVVDPQLRVHGIKNLRVVDASIMPEIIGGNTAAPTVMIAEKGADLILGNTPRTI